MASSGASARVFFAAWPAPAIQQALGDLALELKARCGGRAIPAANVHLTLVFLGDVSRAVLPRFESLAASIDVPRFDLSVDHLGYFRHNRLIWAGIERCPPAALTLVGRLAEAAAGEGVRVERRPYVPHITLVRDARQPPAAMDMPALAWPVERFALVESVARERGRAYVPLRQWPLGA